MKAALRAERATKLRADGLTYRAIAGRARGESPHGGEPPFTDPQRS